MHFLHSYRAFKKTGNFTFRYSEVPIIEQEIKEVKNKLSEFKTLIDEIEEIDKKNEEITMNLFQKFQDLANEIKQLDIIFSASDLPEGKKREMESKLSILKELVNEIQKDINEEIDFLGMSQMINGRPTLEWFKIFTKRNNEARKLMLENIYKMFPTDSLEFVVWEYFLRSFNESLNKGENHNSNYWKNWFNQQYEDEKITLKIELDSSQIPVLEKGLPTKAWFEEFHKKDFEQKLNTIYISRRSFEYANYNTPEYATWMAFEETFYNNQETDVDWENWFEKEYEKQKQKVNEKNEKPYPLLT